MVYRKWLFAAFHLPWRALALDHGQQHGLRIGSERGRTRLRTALGLLLLTSGAGFAQLPPLKAPSHWINLPNQQFEVDGLPWYAENHGELFRLPERLKDTYPESVWHLADDPTGGRIRFRTDSSALAIRMEYPSPPSMPNMQALGQSGVDLYVGNTYWRTAIPDKEAKPGKFYEFVYFNFGDAPRLKREITLYLPLYSGVKVLAIGVDANAVIERAAPFALPKPVVLYGTSITQGCCASRPGKSFEAIVGRRLNIDFVNLGFSGAGLYEPALADAVAAIDASCYVLDSSNINTAEALGKVLGPFIQIIREKHPLTPILVVSPIYSSEELIWGIRKSNNYDRRELTRKIVSSLIAQGDRNIQLMEGTDLLSPSQGDGLTDGAHPNDLGFEWIANGLSTRLATMLGLNPKQRATCAQESLNK